MREIELKILNISKIAIIKKLRALGATGLPTALVVEKMFDFPNKSISRRKELLRLRQAGNLVELAYKNPAHRNRYFKILEETQTEVQDFAVMEKILQKIGLRCVKHREKKRASFVLGKTKFEIDEYPGVPAYLEIEGSPREIKKYVRLLGFTMQQTTTLSATSVLKQYKVNHTHLAF